MKLLAFLGSIIIDIITLLIFSLVVFKYWAWFITDMFGVFMITFEQAIAVSAIVMFIKYRYAEPKSEIDWEKLIIKSFTIWVVYFVELGMGYFIHLFIA